MKSSFRNGNSKRGWINGKLKGGNILELRIEVLVLGKNKMYIFLLLSHVSECMFGVKCLFRKIFKL